MPDCFLGIDLGTSAVKVLLVDEGGAVRGSGSAEYPVRRPRPGCAEQDPAEWWRATGEATRQAVSWAGKDARIVGIGVSGQMHGTVLLDEREQPLAPAIIWADQRSWRQVAAITEAVGAARLVELTGSPVAAGFQAATIRWLMEERSSLWWRTKTVLAPKDELRRRLTGEMATDPSDGSGTLLLDARWRDWSPEVLAALEIDVAKLPPVKPSVEVAGPLTAGAGEELGLPAGTPVVVGAGDAASGLLGAGIVEPGTMLFSLSTGAQVMVPARGVHPDPEGRTHCFCSALEPSATAPGWYQMGATLVAGMALRWLRDEMMQLAGGDAYERMSGWAAEAPLGSDGLLFLPYLAGERTPHMDARARGAFLGLTAGHGRGHLVRSVMEGATLAAADAFAVLREQGSEPERMVMAGGGARSPFWRQMAADIFGLPVHALATADQAAMGAALLAASGVAGADPVRTAREWASYGPALEPDRGRHARYAALAALFREAYQPTLELSYKLGAFRGREEKMIEPRRPRRVG